MRKLTQASKFDKLLAFRNHLSELTQSRSTSPQEEMFVDVGVYGVPKNDRFDAEKTTRKVEEFVR